MPPALSAVPRCRGIFSTEVRIVLILHSIRNIPPNTAISPTSHVSTRMQGWRSWRTGGLPPELLERPFAHQYETGAKRRLHLRGRDNVAKRVLLQATAFNLALILRSISKAATPEGRADLKSKLVAALLRVLALWARCEPIFGAYESSPIRSSLSDRVPPNSPELRPSGKPRF